MQVNTFNIPGLLLLTPTIHSDNRGFFVESFKEVEMNEIVKQGPFVQDNFSRSANGVLRGLHYQFDKAQGKFVTCIRGKIFDVAVDIRKNSPNFGQHITVEIDGDRPQWLWIPAGFAHGFCVLGNEPADVLYKVNAPYSPKGEGGILWSDPVLNINWPNHDPIISDKDKSLPSFESYRQIPKFF